MTTATTNNDSLIGQIVYFGPQLQRQSGRVIEDSADFVGGRSTGYVTVNEVWLFDEPLYTPGYCIAIAKEHISLKP